MRGKDRTASLESSTYLTSAKRLEGTRRMRATSSNNCFPFSGLRGLEERKRTTITKLEQQVLGKLSALSYLLLSNLASPGDSLLPNTWPDPRPCCTSCFGVGLLISNSVLLWEKLLLPPDGCSATLTDSLALGSAVSLCIPGLRRALSRRALDLSWGCCHWMLASCWETDCSLTHALFRVTIPPSAASTCLSEVAVAPKQTSDSQW